MKAKIFCLLLVMSCFNSQAIVLIDSVKNITNNTVQKYSRYEISVYSFALVPTPSINVFDSTDVDMYAIFTSPTGKKYRRNAFWMTGTEAQAKAKAKAKASHNPQPATGALAVGR